MEGVQAPTVASFNLFKTKYDETLPKAAEAGDDIAKLKAVIADFEECLPMIEQLAEISPAGMKAGAGLQTAARITDALGSCKDRLAAAEAPPPPPDPDPPDEAPPDWTGPPPSLDGEDHRSTLVSIDPDAQHCGESTNDQRGH